MHGDEHEFDYETLGEHGAAEIWCNKKACASLISLMLPSFNVNSGATENDLDHAKAAAGADFF